MPDYGERGGEGDLAQGDATEKSAAAEGEEGGREVEFGEAGLFKARLKRVSIADLRWGVLDWGSSPVRHTQRAKALSPMLVSVAGRVSEVTPQPANEPSPIVLTGACTVRAVSEIQSSKAPSPMV